jgi:hypothetical protein
MLRPDQAAGDMKLHRQQGDAFPTYLAEEGQVNPGEDPGGQGSAPGEDKLPGFDQTGVIRGEPAIFRA